MHRLENVSLGLTFELLTLLT